MQTFKYNYNIAGGSGFYDVAYSDLKDLPNVVYHNSILSGIGSKIFRYLIRLNFNLTLNKLVATPLRSLVFNRLFPARFEESKPICYIFFEVHFAVINTSYIDYLKKRDPQAKFVLYMQDVISSLPYYNVTDYRKKFDLILSYDKGDCRRYGFIYYPTPFSKINFGGLKSYMNIDVWFCGAGKTRYKTILNVYKELTSQGFRCEFFITGVPQEDRISGDGLHYDQRVSYVDNLRYAAASKCILEVMQKDADGFTPRLWEAIMYDKHLLTNNESVRNSPYWNPEGMHLLSECDNFSCINNTIEYSDEIKRSKSPVNLLHFIERQLC